MTARFRRRAEGRRASAARIALRVVLPAAVLLLLLSAAALGAVETDNVRSYWDGLWWSLSLMTTVGFVGAEPATALGKILSAALMVFGFITLATTTAAVASLFVREDELPEERREQGFEQRMLDELRALTRRLAAIERELDRTSAQTASDAALLRARSAEPTPSRAPSRAGVLASEPSRDTTPYGRVRRHAR